MCGFVVIEGTSGESTLDTMLQRIRHRGPDGIGTCVRDGIAMGHVRLSIIDVAGGSQPMFNEDGSICIVFNGEIYNFQELRESLSARHTFRTRSDTEVILHLYEEIGKECVNRLDGMFCFAILAEGELFVARDRLGIKPLYTGKDSSGSRVFASEMKAMIGCTGIEPLQPGSYYTTAEGFRDFYALPAGGEQSPATEGETIRDIRALLGRAVEKRLVADVPVAVFLSGGLDSSIIAAMMRASTEHLYSFSVGVEGAPDLSAARRVAQHLGTEHYAYIYTPEEMLEVLPDVIYHLESFDAPLVRSAIPGYFLARLARERVKVVLTGEGADELFGGYHYLSRISDRKAYRKQLHTITRKLHNTNLQRTDRITMAHAIEARVPFLDIALVEYSARIPSEWLQPTPGRPEKYLLRKATEDLLPADIVWRKKQKFSEGAGSMHLLEEHAERTISNEEFHTERSNAPFPIRTKEELLYFRTFRAIFGNAPVTEAIGRTDDLEPKAA